MIRRPVLIAISIAIFGFLALLTFSFSQLRHVQKILSVDVGENMVWALARAEVDTRKLYVLLLEAETEVLTDEMRRRSDIILSRFSLLSDRPQIGHIEKLNEVETIVRSQKALENVFGQIEIGHRNEVMEVLSEVADDLARLSNMAMISDREERGRQRDRQEAAVNMIMFAFAGIFLASVTLCWQLVLNIRAASTAKSELLRHRDELEAVVMHRTEELRSALEAERDAKEVYRNFITTVSHQFRTPLSIIDMVAQRFIRRPTEFNDISLQDKARRVRKAVRRLFQIVSSVTAAARLDDGGAAIRIDPSDLNDIIESACEFSRDIMPERTINLLPSDVDLSLNCDPALVEQVVLNLISNAAKYSDHSSPIYIKSGRLNGDVWCSVEDQGAGIPEAEQIHIFKRFYRAGNINTIEGSGLGLSLSLAIAKMHGGNLRFESREGEGSIFTLTLPVIRVEKQH